MHNLGDVSTLAQDFATSNEEHAAMSEPSGVTVLYVEPEERDAILMGWAFVRKGLGSALRLVCDGPEAIDYLSGAGKFGERHNYPVPAVVLLGLKLPEMPGLEVSQWMRNHPDFATTPVVVFSASTGQDERAKAQELGVTEFVARPKSGLEFTQVVEQLRERWLGRAGL
jgi:CheY-like chemotaxis protein